MTTLTAAPAGYSIEQVDMPTASDDLIAQAVALQHAMDAERQPEDPPHPDEQLAQMYRVSSEMWKREYLGAFANGRLVAGGAVGRNVQGSNLNHRFIDISVHPEHRRRGLGRALLARALELVGEGDDILINSWTTSRVPAGGKFAERVGAKPGLGMRVSQLDLRSIDRALMRQWASLDPAGYRLEVVTGPTPDHLMQSVIDARRAINRMPREGLQMDDWTITEETIRDGERTSQARGVEVWAIYALGPNGEGAGFTDVAIERRYPHLIHQRGTAVDPAHQGKGIGKWMKARMVEKILAELPEAKLIRTDNAGTNAPMLGINVKMGFTPAWEATVWQLPLAEAKKYLGR